MYYSGNLLKRYLSLPIECDTIAQELTMKTCEIESHTLRDIPELVVIGKVTKVEKHPDADKLVVCQLDCGTKGKRQICTGGENVVENSYVPVALPGCHLPVINLSIEPRKMRGLDSDGMICSKSELGIPEDIEEHRIWTLQYGEKTDPALMVQEPDMDDISDADLGIPLGEKYPRLENRILDIENKTITHRPDLWGHFGLGIELHSIFGKNAPSFANGRKYMEQMQHGTVFEMLSHATPSQTKVHSKTDGLNTYTLIELNNIEVKRSDFFMRLALYDIGQQPRYNWVDFSNLFMYLTGQPIHFFDADKVAGDITVRHATDGEKFIDLFEGEHELQTSDIVIADKKSVLALAGVMGGLNSGVDEDTTKILVEIGNFDPVMVRKTGTRLGLRSDAELRFEKHINPRFTLHTINMFLDEIKYSQKSLGNFEIGGLDRYINDHNKERVSHKIEIDFDRIARTISGVGIPDFEDKAREILTNLGFGIDQDTITVPVWRSPDDCIWEADIVEEIARMIGLSNIPEEEVRDPTKFVPFTTEVRLQRRIEELLTGTGNFDQVETYPRLHKKWIDLLDLETDNCYKMVNPISPEQKYLRSDMIRHMVEVLGKNAPVYNKLRIFDIGTTWKKTRDKPEHHNLAFGIYDKDQSKRSQNSYLLAKSILNTVLDELQFNEFTLETTEHSYFHPRQQSNIIIDGKIVGMIATLHSFRADQAKLPSESPFVIVELDLSKLANMLPEHQSPTYETLGDQIVWIDLNFVMDKSDPYILIANAIKSVEAIEDINVFDIYAGDNLEKGKKSIGFRIKIKGDGKMKTEEINAIMDQAIAAVKEAGYDLRS